MQIFGGGHEFVTDADRIPGRNYLSGTAPKSVQGKNIVGQGIATYALTDKSLSNQVVTFNMTITSDTTSGRLYVGSSPNWQVYTYSDIQKGINKIQFTTELNSDVDAIKLSLDNSTANLVIQDATLNKGNFAREYLPAPEDIAIKSNTIGGGINLYQGTKDFSGTNWVFGAGHYQINPYSAIKNAYQDLTALEVNAAWNGVRQDILANSGETYTFSGFIKKGTGNPNVMFYGTAQGVTNIGNVDSDGKQINITDGWSRFSITFTVTIGGTIQPRIESSDGGPDTTYFIAGLKLERGTVATPWCPAPEDYAMKSDLEALKAEIEQLKQNK